MLIPNAKKNGMTKLSQRDHDIITKRYNGATLKAIGDEYGVSREAIRYICLKGNLKYINRTCKECGTTRLTLSNNHQRYCSDKCRKKTTHKERFDGQNPEKCPICGDLFPPLKSHPIKTCSTKCGQLMRRKRAYVRNVEICAMYKQGIPRKHLMRGYQLSQPSIAKILAPNSAWKANYAIIVQNEGVNS